MSGAVRRIRANSNKRGRSGAKLRNEEEASGPSQSEPKTITEDRSTPPLETPRVLTRGNINFLTHGLDASDVVECYALVRSAPLHGIANSAITIQKMTIGIRFRPKVADLKNPFNVKTPMELTLEYGPARLGPLLSDEATPIVQGNDESNSYLTWDNTAKVYYTQKIDTGSFLSSHYMASMTGAVLNKLLSEAVEYTENRKVYKPFAIYSENGNLLMRSSSSSDFTWYVWSHLAKLGVEIEPILPPAMYEARLYTKSVEKVFPDESVVREAATFYQRLYGCLESIATNNYGSFLSSKEQPTINDDEDAGDDDSTSSTGTTSANAENGGNRKLGVDSERLNHPNCDHEQKVGNESIHRLVEETHATETETPTPIDTETLVPTVVETKALVDTQSATDTVIPEAVETEVPADTETKVPVATVAEASANEEENLVKNSIAHDEPKTVIDEDEETFQDTSVPEDRLSTDAPTKEPTSVGTETPIPTEDIQDVEKAQNAANDAQKAADEAKIAAQTEGETKAADAAQAAADAALAAADATSSAASQAAMDSLLSGDGTMMSSIVATCFSNPRYGISSPDANRTVPIEMYLVRDPSLYYRLELTSPYLDVVKLNRPLPKAAALLSDYGAGGDALDWTLAMTIFFSVFLMVLLICQQMGKRYVGSIFKCQRWFFNPRTYGGDELESTSGVQSGSHFFFGKSGIPVSMGGQQSSYSPLKNRQSLQNMIVDESFTDDDGDDGEHDLGPFSPNLPLGSHRAPTHQRLPSRELEMVNFGPDSNTHNGDHTPRLQPYKDSSDSSNGSSEEDGARLEFPDRLRRNPDLVDMPSLKSKSKVAVPVGTPGKGSGAYSASSSFGEASADSSNLLN